MRRQVWGAHPFIWAGLCGLIAVLAVLVAVTLLGDPHRSERRPFLQQCRDQVQDQGVPDNCGRLANARFGRFDSAGEDILLGLAAVAVFAGTVIIVMYVVRSVSDAVEQLR